MDCRRRLRADLREIVKFLILRAPVPVEPADLIVLAIGIVVARWVRPNSSPAVGCQKPKFLHGFTPSPSASAAFRHTEKHSDFRPDSPNGTFAACPEWVDRGWPSPTAARIIYGLDRRGCDAEQ